MSNLALTMRPETLDQLIGSEHIKKALKSFAEKNNWPNVFLLQGPPGTGKTTLALIIAEMCGADSSAIHEINAAKDNGVDAARALEDLSSSSPLTGQRRVIILNEAHALTPQAQNALKDPMEKGNCVWVLTTDKPDKLEPAIKSRAAAATFELKPLNKAQIWDLVDHASNGRLVQHDATLLTEFLLKHGITSPREILGVLDQHLAGVPIEEAIHGSEHEPLYPEVASAVLSGNWTKTSGLLKQIKTADYRAMVAVVSAKLGWALLDEGFGPRADAIAACLVGLGNAAFADGVAFASLKGLLYKATKVLQEGGRK